MIGRAPPAAPGREGPSILLTFANLSWQKGSAAQVISLVHELRKTRPFFRLALLSQWPERDREPARELGIEIVGPAFLGGASRNRRSLILLLGRLRCVAWGLMRRLWLEGSRKMRDPVTSAYAQADFVLDLSGDSYRDPPGGFAHAHNVNFLAALACGRPFAVASQSVGPFRSHSRWLVRFVLERAAAVYLRERESERIALELGAPPDRVRIAPDLAFALPAGSAKPIWRDERLEPGCFRRPWVAVSASRLSAELAFRGRGRDYLEEMARLCRHVHDRYGGSVFVVPHEVEPSGVGPDDRSVGKELCRRLKEPDWARAFSGDYPPDRLKGFIAGCDALVAARMHAAIAGLSSGVPTIAVAWSHKYAGLMQSIGLDEYVWDQYQPRESLPNLFDRLWIHRHRIRARLVEYTAAAQAQIAAMVEDLARLVEAQSSFRERAVS